MVKGIDSFRKWFEDYRDRYVIIGGTACDLLMSDEGLDFRATKDIDLVLIVEALDAEFARRFWEYVIEAGYEHRNKSTGEPQFYRFSKPKSDSYPVMIELFSRRSGIIALPDDATLSPLPIEEDISSLSAILLDEDYYNFLLSGRTAVSGVTVLDAMHLIPFKAKAWMDLSDRKVSGEHIDEKAIRKHKNDVFRLTEILGEDSGFHLNIPASIRTDMKNFLEKTRNENIDLKQIGIRGRTKEEILGELKMLYGIE